MYIENISRLSTEIGCKQQASESWQVALPLEVLIYGRALEHVVFTLQQCLGQEVEKRELTWVDMSWLNHTQSKRLSSLFEQNTENKHEE